MLQFEERCHAERVSHARNERWAQTKCSLMPVLIAGRAEENVCYTRSTAHSTISLAVITQIRTEQDPEAEHSLSAVHMRSPLRVLML